METARIHIVFTTDVHGQLTPVNFATRGRSSKGLSRLKNFLDGLEGERILIDGGDILQGSPLIDHWIGKTDRGPCPVATVLNRLGYDYVTIGNHEFNYGMDVLSAYTSDLSAQVVCGNVRVHGKQLYPGHAVRTFANGVRIGFVGAVTQAVPSWEKPSNIRGVAFEDAYAMIRREVAEIRDGVDCVVAIYHGGIEKDIPTGLPIGPRTSENEGFKIAKHAGADVILTGHQHRNVIDRVDGRCIVQVTDQASAFALLTLTFAKEDGGWRFDGCEAETRSLSDFESDPDIEDLLSDLTKETDVVLDRVLLHLRGTGLVVRDPFTARRDNHPLFRLLNQAQLWRSGAMLSSASLPNAVPGLKAKVTMRDIAATFIYPNSLMVLEIDGRRLKAALEKTAEYFALGTDGDVVINPAHFRPKIEHYNYDVFAGIAYTIDVSRPQGSRISELRYRRRPVRDDDVFTIALNNYRAGGGGQYAMFKDAKLLKEITSSTADIVVEYLVAHPDFRSRRSYYPIIRTGTRRD
ncbi:MAG: bifunctional UDP-sugar hydrolase/5'-nucleotidase [Candidatus Izemoplasmatales bacterium]